MANWKVTINGKGIRKATVEKLVQMLKEEFGEGTIIGVQDNTPPESRSDRFSAAQGSISDAKSEFESLRDELQEWRDNLPEGFTNGEKGEQLDSAISELEEAISSAEDLEGKEVEFPGMY